LITSTKGCQNIDNCYLMLLRILLLRILPIYRRGCSIPFKNPVAFLSQARCQIASTTNQVPLRIPSIMIPNFPNHHQKEAVVASQHIHKMDQAFQMEGTDTCMHSIHHQHFVKMEANMAAVKWYHLRNLRELLPR